MEDPLENSADGRRLLDLIPDLICLARPDGTLLWVNEAYADMYRRNRSDLIGTNFLDLLTPGVRPEVQQNLTAELTAGVGEISRVIDLVASSSDQIRASVTTLAGIATELGGD